MNETADANEGMSEDLVGPVIRAGDLAEAVIDAVAEDNPHSEVTILDRGDYVRIHTERECRLTKSSLEKHLGRDFDLALLEAEMPSFKGRMRSKWDEMVWFYSN